VFLFVYATIKQVMNSFLAATTDGTKPSLTHFVSIRLTKSSHSLAIFTATTDNFYVVLASGNLPKKTLRQP
jgi:hypothetical protein